MKVGPVVRTAAQAAKIAVKYGPQAKIAWDNGGKQAAARATKRAKTLNARRRAFAHAAGVVEGTVLKIAPSGSTVYVVFTGERPIAAYPPQDLPFSALLEHADLSRRMPAVPAEPSTTSLKKLPRPVRRKK
ncbi:hypothetical protein [Nocardioides speluncae]|uniref:hypothetical protein n=1 Tax=Nocardioides speluncae TaxID=2670337 RepID=UPI000D6913BF|nr:hypothetical protein [Nocardioides speluncae]